MSPIFSAARLQPVSMQSLTFCSLFLRSSETEPANEDEIESANKDKIENVNNDPDYDLVPNWRTAIDIAADNPWCCRKRWNADKVSVIRASNVSSLSLSFL